ncbi:MAG: polyprenyl synthetase family protein [Planctomycetota bacterium]
MSDSPADFLRTFAAEFDGRFDAYLKVADVPAQLREAVRYSALAPGKRIRPYLVARCCELVGGRRDDAWPAAAAIECVHAFSLVHDDLPAMDDDDLRRGRPTTHKQFNEALAILAGDALLALAFELLVRHTPDRTRVGEMVLELARRTGWTGMIGGQAADVLGQGTPPSEDLVKYIHGRKTASLFEAACRLGAMAGEERADAVAALGRFGRHLGQAFQIADDLLDVTATSAELGKRAGKDVSAGKQTYPRCVGVEASRAMAAEEVQAAVAELSPFGPSANDLRALAEYAVSRNY